MFRIPATRLAEVQSSQQSQTYMYRFDWQSPAAGGALGACHALDIPFAFGTHTLPGMGAFAGEGPGADALAESMTSAWLAFARSGDPSTPALSWPAFDAAARRTMVLDAESHVEERPQEAELQCWKSRR